MSSVSVTSALSHIDRYWRSAMPADRLAMLRVITGLFAVCYLLARTGHLTSYAHFDARDFAPIGVLSLLEAPLNPSWVYAMHSLTIVVGIGFLTGAAYKITGPLFAVGFLLITTYRNCWGMIFHQDNLVALHLLVLAVAPAHHAWAIDARRRAKPERSHGRYGWPVRAMCWLTVVSYVLAGIAKLEGAGWDWSSGDVLRTHVAYDALRKLELGGIHSPIGAWLVPYQWPFAILGPLTLLLELGAPLALLHKRISLVWVLGIWGFHLGVILLMAITFAYPVSGAAFAAFFPVERLARQRHLHRILSWLGPATQSG